MKNYKRIADEYNTKILNKYLDRLYEKEGWNFERVLDVERQLSGIDVIFRPTNYIGKELLVDEKAATKFLDRDLYTFSFELRSENNKEKTGWLISSKSKTTHYAIIYPRSKTNKINELDSLEWILVDKQKIIDTINKIPNFENYIERVYDDCYENKCTGRNQFFIRIYKKENSKSPLILKLVWSKNIFPERPLNILFPKSELIKMSDKYIRLEFKRKI